MEYIDRQKIICAVIMEVKNQRLRLLAENNREANLSVSRLSHKSNRRLDLSMGRDKLTEALKAKANRRKTLAEQIDIKELWEVLNTEQEWIDLATMTEFCFPDNPTDDHEASVIRAFFSNRIYFKFNQDQFFPNTREQVEHIINQSEEAARKERIIESGGNWLRDIFTHDDPPLPDSEEEWNFTEILKSLYLFEKDSPHYELGKAMLDKAGIDAGENLFQMLVKLKVWNYDENTDIYRYDIPVSFSDKVIEYTSELAKKTSEVFETSEVSGNNRRRDLTDLPLMTIDGHGTLDFDDALSIEDTGEYYLLGVHIADVGHYVKKGEALDKEAFFRGSSIYMPDQKIPMLPTGLSDDICSLKAGEIRPAVSIMIKIERLSSDILDYEIFPSLIRIKDQLTYHEVNQITEENKELSILYNIAKMFREKRLSGGAVQINLPEVNIWIEENGDLVINRAENESPGRILVSETMIMANWMMAKFLVKNGLPSIYRSQAEPRSRLYKNENATLYQNWMQRRLLSRFMLGHGPERHSGLGLDAYMTATSPIRKYSDLVAQRQIKAVFGMETPYTSNEIDKIIQMLDNPMRNVAKMQYLRKRYWLLKYLERKVGGKEEAIVLTKRKNNYAALIPEYMIECDLPMPGGCTLKPEDLIQIRIQHVNARRDVLSVFMG